MPKSFLVKPSVYAACVELTGGNLTAAGLLCQAVIRAKGKTLKDESGQDGWLVLSSTQWRCLTGFTRHQHNNALHALKSKSLIDHRRRKLRYNDPAALAWIRVPEHVKSGIAEIMSGTGISAFDDLTTSLKSPGAENESMATSDAAEALMVNEMTKNEDKKENVVIEKTKKEFCVSQAQAGSSKINNSALAQNWFNSTIAEIYKGSQYSPEPFQKTSYLTLKEILAYLDENLGSELNQNIQSPVAALHTIILSWADFSWFAQTVFGGFNIPMMPQLWSMKHQLKCIPEYVKYQQYLTGLEEAARVLGFQLNKSAAVRRDLDKFGEYGQLAANARHEFLTKLAYKEKPSVSAGTLKIQKMLNQKKW